MNAPIGVIDSGVGGLTVVRELLEQIPNEQIYYIGDDARCPYGPRSPEEVQQFTLEMANDLAEKGIKLLVIACNTATAVTLEKIQETFSFPVIGVIQPGARAAINVSTNDQIAVLGTEGTVKSKAYDTAIVSLRPNAMIQSLACPRFVPIVEKGQYKTDYAKEVVYETLEQLTPHTFDTVILGCTHYPLLEKYIERYFNGQKTIISSAVETVADVKKILEERDIATTSSVRQQPIFYTSGNIEKFHAIVVDWLRIEHPIIQTIQFS